MTRQITKMGNMAKRAKRKKIAAKNVRSSIGPHYTGNESKTGGM
jgi:hypothetical protein